MEMLGRSEIEPMLEVNGIEGEMVIAEEDIPREPEISKQDVMKAWGMAERDRARYEKDWQVYIDKYDGKVLYARKEWQSNVSIPEIYRVTKALVAQEMHQYWSKKFWKIEAMTPDGEKSAKMKDKLSEIRIMGYPHRMRIWEKASTQKYLLGAGVIKQWYDGGWRFGNVSPYNFYPEPGKETIDECKYVFHEDLMPKKAVREMFAEKVWTTKFEDVDVDVMIEGSAADPHKAMKPAGMELDLEDQVHVLEYWENDILAVIINKKWIVRSDKNPFEIFDRFGTKRKPFIALQCGVSLNNFWGDPIPFNMWNISDKIDRHFNMALDLARLNVNPPRIMGIGAGLFSDVVFDQSPGKVYRLNRINEDKKESYDGALPANNLALQLLRNAADSTHAVNDAIMGEEKPASNDTATGKAVVYEAASKRIELYTYQNEDFCVDFVTMWLDIEKQFMGIEDRTAIKMKDRRHGIYTDTLTRPDMDMPCDVIVKPPRQMVNRLAYLQNELQKFAALKGQPEIDMSILIKRLLEAFEDPNPDEAILDENEMVTHAVMMGQIEQKVQAALAPPMAEAQMQGQQSQPMQSNNPEVMAGGMQ